MDKNREQKRIQANGGRRTENIYFWRDNRHLDRMKGELVSCRS